jgi:thiol-disulfide isomerase/thioredoxin
MLNAAVGAGLKAPELDHAKRMIDNPRRAREAFAPDFSLTTRAGEFISSKDLAGRTVLLDFWGTWCGPCRDATPGLVNLYKRLEGPSFELIGISSDPASDKQVWMDYIDKNKMLWPQHQDTTRAVHRAFQIEAFPTYIVVDAEGVIRLRLTGFSPSSTMSALESDIKKSLKAAAK